MTYLQRERVDNVERVYDEQTGEQPVEHARHPLGLGQHCHGGHVACHAQDAHQALADAVKDEAHGVDGAKLVAGGAASAGAAVAVEAWN